MKFFPREFFQIPCSKYPVMSCLHRSEGAKHFVVLVHGFASHKVGTKRAWVHLADLFASHGIHAVRFDLSGCGDSYGTLEESSFIRWVDECADVVRFYQNMGWTPLGIFGSSLGGALAAYAAEKTPVKAVGLWAPVASGQLWLSEMPQKNLSFQKTEDGFDFGGLHLSAEFIQEFLHSNAALVSEKLKMPLWHAQAKDDPVISLHHQQLFQKHREGFEKESSFVTLEGKDHMMFPYFDKIAEKCVLWFKSCL